MKLTPAQEDPIVAAMSKALPHMSIERLRDAVRTTVAVLPQDMDDQALKERLLDTFPSLQSVL